MVSDRSSLNESLIEVTMDEFRAWVLGPCEKGSLVFVCLFLLFCSIWFGFFSFRVVWILRNDGRLREFAVWIYLRSWAG